MHTYLQGLNDAQLAAVTHIDGPLMIVAGAGSGKTKVLTTRIAHLMNNGVSAFNILALTFTNKAAAEMKERIEKVLGNNDSRNLYAGTFHSVFARILRAEATKIGFPSNFTIYDTDDSRSVLKTVVNEMGLDDKLYKPNIIHNRISSAKNALVTAEEYQFRTDLQQEDSFAKRPAFAKIFKAYCDRCFKNGAMDFDDLLLKMFELLKTHNDVLNKYQNKFKYVLVDEYQDTNAVQYQITKLLAALNENICVVGDDAQSIYSFRGATIQNILDFQKDYDDVTIIKLEQNYRSTKSILEVANTIINNNKGQLPKELWTENAEGEKIKVVRVMTDNDEGKFTADCIQEQRLRNHFNNSEFAILYRTNAQSRSYEENLRRMGIPYRIYGGLSFYQRKEVKDIICYLRLIINTQDEEALKRVINYPARGIGKTTMEKLGIIASSQNITLFEAVKAAASFGLKGGSLEALQNFVTMITYFQTMLATGNAYDVAQQVGKHTGLVSELFADKTTEGLARYENIQELFNSIKQWIESPDNEDGEVGDKSLGSYLQQITLLTNDEKEGESNDVVKLMTIHAAKGLEFECVFVGGLEETLFPSGMSINTLEELEEERRLFYVAITRAKQKLWLTNCNTRYRFGQLISNNPSRFLDEIPKAQLDSTQAGNSVAPNRRFNSDNDFDFRTRPSNLKQPAPSKPSYLPVNAPPKVATHIPSENFVSSAIDQLEQGKKVEHQKFGFGTITKIEGSNHNPIATIEFEKNGERKIMLNYAKLRVVE